MVDGCKKKYWVLAVTGVLMAVIGGVLFPVGDILVREQVKKKVVIANTSASQQYDIWQDNPVPLYQQFYVFNVENPTEVLEGKKPSLTEKGPYTYREYRVKYDIDWNDNGTVTYKQNRTFYFVPEMSVGPDTDTFTTLNPLLVSLSQALKLFPGAIVSVVSLVLGVAGESNAFIQRSVYDLIWGYEDTTLRTLNGLLPNMFPETQIGYFIRRNYTDDGVYTVGTGSHDIDGLCIIEEYNGDKYVHAWTTPWTNLVNGSDGSCGPPFVFDVTMKKIFQSDICRSLTLFYSKDTESPQGISLRRYVAEPMNFENVTENPDNIGFCTPQTNCLPSGLLNSTMCEKPVDGVPVPLIISWPHFLWADPSVQNSVVGLHPNEEDHQSAVDVEPWTGFFMRINKRIQINFFVEKVEGIRQLKNIGTLYFPIMWFNETIVVDNEHADLVKNELLLPLNILLGAKIGLLALGGLVLLLGVGLCCRNRRKGKIKDVDDKTNLLKGKERNGSSYNGVGGES